LPPVKEYEYLANIKEMSEYFEIDEMITNGIANYDSKKSIDWDNIK